MNTHVLIAIVLLAVDAGLIFLGLPDKNHESPRFLRFHSASIVYPPLVLVFLAGGFAELFMGF